MLANLKSDESLFRMRTVTAREIFQIAECCDARRIKSAELGETTKAFPASDTSLPLSACGDSHVDVTILLRHQHRGLGDEDGATGTVATRKGDFIGLTPPSDERARASKAGRQRSDFFLSPSRQG
jgi:hypothetical protein